MRAALYVRVSSKEQTTENQERELRRWAEGLGFQVAQVYRETVTGAQGDRAALTAALAKQSGQIRGGMGHHEDHESKKQAYES